MKYLAILLIKAYKLLISPLLGNCCRFYPSCSTYAMEAFQEKPFFNALWMTIKRILSCNPWSS
jgi:putative membrane protein insertion efficiency factor